MALPQPFTQSGTICQLSPALASKDVQSLVLQERSQSVQAAPTGAAGSFWVGLLFLFLSVFNGSTNTWILKVIPFIL